MPRPAQSDIRVFISHSGRDRDLAKAMVRLLTDTLAVEPSRIRCTTAQGHNLGLGVEIGATLADDIRASQVLIGLITTASIESQWVLFELGAAWALGKRIVPLIHPLLSVDVLPGPLASVNATTLEDIEGMAQALEDISTIIGCRYRSPSTLETRLRQATTEFMQLAQYTSQTLLTCGPNPPSPKELHPSVSNLTAIRRGGTIRNHIHPMMEKLFGAEIDEFLSQIADAVNENTIRFNDSEKFRYHYARMFNTFPDSHFLATSLPYERYFWTRPSDGTLSAFELKMQRFIQGGGRFTRVFFLHSRDSNSAEIQRVINAQLSLGVEVFAADADSLPNRLLRFFVVDQQQNVGWHVDIDTTQRLTNIRFTVAPDKLKRYNQWFDQIMEHEGTHRLN